MSATFLNRLTHGLATLRRTLDAGPGNTSGQPLSVAGHLVFAPYDETSVRSR
jgi:hypothetical protein